VNKNVSRGTIVRAKPGTELGVQKLLANYQTGGYKVRLTIRMEESDCVAAICLWMNSPEN